MVKLPIDVIPDTVPPRFVWQRTADTPVGQRLVDMEGYLPASVDEAVERLIDLTKELDADCAKLQAFKDWVHKYLDDHGVPHHPPGSHGAAGCRIGDRMDWLMAKLKDAEEKANPLIEVSSVSKSKPTPAPAKGK